MSILRNSKNEFEIYENQSKGILVAINKADAKTIKAYYKKYKGKTNPPREKIKGNPFIMDKEFESLKVDFSTTGNYNILDLQKFKG